MLYKRSFLLFLTSQGISNIGDTFQLIASAMLIIKITGSGLSAGFGLISSCIPGILFSTLAGGLGDIFREKYMLITVDLLRAAVVILFIGSSDVITVYILLAVLSSLDVLYSPPRKRLIVNIADTGEIITANTLLSGISGAAYLFGPVLAGIIVGRFGTEAAFFINSMSFVLSALIILFVKYRRAPGKVLSGNIFPGRFFPGKILRGIKDGFTYYRSSAPIREIVSIAAVIGFMGISVNIAFYSLAFDVLKVTGKGWGYMLSVYYGISLAAVPIPFILKEKVDKFPIAAVYPLLLVISTVWFFYGIADNYFTVLVLLVIEGISFTFCGILLGTYLQIITKRSFVARISGVNDIIGSVARILGIAYAYLVISVFSSGILFTINSLAIASFAFYKIFYRYRRREKTQQN